MSKRKKPVDSGYGPFHGVTFTRTIPPLTVEQRLGRLEKQVLDLGSPWLTIGETKTLLERVDWLFRYFRLEFKTTPGTPPETKLIRKHWWK